MLSQGILTKDRGLMEDGMDSGYSVWRMVAATTVRGCTVDGMVLV